MKLNMLGSRIIEAFEARRDVPIMAFVHRNETDVALDGKSLDAEVAMRAQRLKDWLGPGRRVVVAMPKNCECILMILACIVAGVTVVPVAVPRRGSKLERFAHIVEDCDCAAVICAPESFEAVSAAMPVSQPCPVVTTPLAEDLPAISRTRDEAVEAVIQYTSGSTRMPKGVRISGQNILANCDLVSRGWGMDAGARFVSWLPQFHDMGLMGGILYPLLCGGFSAQMSPHDFIRSPLAWLTAIDRYRANFSGGPAFGFAQILRRVPQEALADLDLSCWWRAFCGAEPVPAFLRERFNTFLAPAGLPDSAFFACYGMAEMTLFAAGIPANARYDMSSPTVPCILDDETRALVRIADPATGDAIRDGGEGEILVRGTSKGLGYLNTSVETRSVFGASPVDWLKTGDLGAIKDDMLHVTGRLKDIVICNGRNIAASEIEWLACLTHGCLDPLAAVAFAPDPLISGQVVIIAEPAGRAPAPGRDDRLGPVSQALTGEWGVELLRLIVVPRGRLSRTTSGKIRRQDVAQAFREGQFDAPQD